MLVKEEKRWQRRRARRWRSTAEQRFSRFCCRCVTFDRSLTFADTLEDFVLLHLYLNMLLLLAVVCVEGVVLGFVSEQMNKLLWQLIDFRPF